MASDGYLSNIDLVFCNLAFYSTKPSRVVVLLAAELHFLQAIRKANSRKKQGDIANEDQDEDQSWRRCLGHLAKLSRVLALLSRGTRHNTEGIGIKT